MDSLNTAIAVGIFSLAGALIGAFASTVGPWLLQRHQRKMDDDRRLIEARGIAIRNLVNAWVELASELPPIQKEARAIAANNALTDVILVLPVEHQPVVRWVGGVMRAIASELKSTDRRMGIANHAGLELLDWHKGLKPMESLRPFEFVGYGERSELLVRVVKDW